MYAVSLVCITVQRDQLNLILAQPATTGGPLINEAVEAETGFLYVQVCSSMILSPFPQIFCHKQFV